MKVLTAIVAALFLVAAHAQCHDICSGGAVSCQTKNEAASCKTNYGLSSNNKCVQCGSTPTAGTGNVGMAAGLAKWWEPWNNGKCTTCVANCATCNDASNCKTCASGFWPIASVSKTCTSCGSNCVTCASDKTCQLCKSGFYPKAGVCTACTANCKTCVGGAGPKCDNDAGCDAKYRKAADGNCVSCDATAAGTHWDATKAGKCSTCGSNCAVGGCADATSCKTCFSGSAANKKQGYFLVAKACTTCTANCAVCATAKTCKTCFSGYQKSTAGACVACGSVGTDFVAATGKCTDPCTANCKTCANSKTCTKCKDGYIVNGGTCHQCTVAGCQTCTFAKRTSQCTKCSISYFGKEGGGGPYTGCVQCDANCNAGTGCKSTTQCSGAGCKTGFKVAENGKCVACVTAPAGKVTAVWVPTFGLTCVSCFAGCQGSAHCGVDANNKAECKTCQPAYWPYDDTGAALGTQTTKPGTKNKAKCEACLANCATCASKNTCKTCVNGYSAKGGACQQCTAGNCNKCTGAANVCTTCKVGYELSAKGGCVLCNTLAPGVHWNNAGDGTCSNPCTANCKTCAGAKTCTTCVKGGNKPGYKKSGTSTCEACTQSNCHTCDADKTKCDAAGCYTGFQRDNKGVCHKCAHKGTQWFDAADGSCTNCKPNCVGCSSKTTCGTCADGYYKTSKGDCAACGVSNCRTCTEGTHTTLCSACKGKYAISTDKKSCSNQCDAHATQCKDANTASACDTAKKYHLSGGRCVYCNVDTVAQAAKKNTGTLWWDGANCATCDPNANGCKSSISSRACKKGYTVNGNYCTADCGSGQAAVTTFAKGKCYTCDSHSAKGKCANPWTTTECNKGYHVQSAIRGKCCGDDSGAPAMFSGVAALAGLVAAVAALLH